MRRKINKKGFTLIEIIICLIIIVSIGMVSIFGLKIIQKNNIKKELNEIDDKIYEAVNVYIETKNSTKDQLYNQNNAVIIPLNVIKNEGLLDFKNININDHYVISMLGGKTPQDACVGTTEIGSWEVKINSNVIYLCTDAEMQTYIETTINNLLGSNYVTINKFNEEINKINQKIDEIKNNGNNKTITVQDNLNNDGYYIAKGKNPKNYVKFEVNAGDSSKDFAFFPNDSDKDLWRIININEDGNIKLIYNKAVKSNNEINYTDNSTGGNTSYRKSNKGGYTYYNYVTLYQLKSGYKYTYKNYEIPSKRCTNYDNPYINYKDNSKWSILDVYDTNFDNNVDTKLEYLYKNIKYNNFIEETDYKFTYMFSNGIYTNLRGTKKQLFGTLTLNDVDNSILFDNSWLFDVNTLSGIREYEDSCSTSYYSINLSNGSASRDNITGLFYYYNPGWGGQSSWNLNAHYLYTYDYYPVITLKSNVKLLSDSSCSKSNISGTKDCPYLLKYN